MRLITKIRGKIEKFSSQLLMCLNLLIELTVNTIVTVRNNTLVHRTALLILIDACDIIGYTNSKE